MELTDEIRKAVLKELIEKYERIIEVAENGKARKCGIDDWKLVVVYLKHELGWYDCPAYKLLNNKFEEENK